MPIIYTPTTIWKNFIVQGEPSYIGVGKKEIEGITFEKGFVEGRYVDDQRVKIYVQSAKQGEGQKPAIIIFDEYGEYDRNLMLKEFAKKGYYAIVFNVTGTSEESENFTVYPEKIKHANLIQSDYDNKEINSDVTKTCWYEWCGVAKYVYEYVKSLDFVNKVGCLGINGGATTLWHFLATEDKIDCAVFLNNTGWSVYEGKSKFVSSNEESYSDGKIAYIAGIEPQSYASHVKCPSLIISATGNANYDCDRAYDSLTRINENLYKSINYSVNRRDGISKKSFESAYIFLEKFLSSKRSSNLPLPLTATSVEEEDVKVTVEADQKGLKCFELYVSEGVTDSCKRCWKKIDEKPSNKGKAEFTFTPNVQYGFAVWFVKAVYKNGYETVSKIFGKTFLQKDGLIKRANKIIYTSRIENSGSQFGPAKERLGLGVIDFNGDSDVEEKVGPLKMQGITGKQGIITFNVCSESVKPDNNSLIIFDAYMPDGGEITVKLYVDYFGEKIEYISKAKIVKTDIWQNVKLSVAGFKTSAGISIKNYNGIEAIEFYSDGEYLINNALWV